MSFAEMLNACRGSSATVRNLLWFAVGRCGRCLHEEMSALTSLHAVAKAPMFSYVDAYFGHGIVGGPLIAVPDVSRQAAGVAVRILRGRNAGDIKTPPIGFGKTRFDWRELQRWGISEASLPARSVVEFRVPTAFEQYKWYIIVAAVLCVVQTIFILVLLLNRRRLERNVLNVSAQRTRRASLAGD